MFKNSLSLTAGFKAQVSVLCSSGLTRSIGVLFVMARGGKSREMGDLPVHGTVSFSRSCALFVISPLFFFQSVLDFRHAALFFVVALFRCFHSH